MLEDRDYMREPSYQRRISVTVALLIINAVVFVVECVLLRYPPTFDSNNLFALSLDGLKHGYVWQLITYQFMHAGILHIVFNCWAIFVFGREVEAMLGARKFLGLYLISGVVGGIVQELAALVWPDHFGGPVVGASASAFGLVAAYAILFPERELTVLLFYFIPVNLTARRLLIFAAILAFGGLFFRSTVANAAHLGGMLAGIGMIFLLQGRLHLPQWKPSARRVSRREFAVKRAGKKSFWGGSNGFPPAEDLSTDEYLQKEVDPILDKISAQGIQSLTPREREILERARSKMNKR